MRFSFPTLAALAATTTALTVSKDHPELPEGHPIPADQDHHALLPETHPIPSQHIFTNPSTSSTSGFRIPTIHESAILARRILRLSSIGTLSTIFPTKPSHSPWAPPASVAGTPIGMMDYFADCEASTGNPTLLAITIATSFKNVAAGSNLSLSVFWLPPPPPPPPTQKWGGRRAAEKIVNYPFSPAAFPRFNLVGYLEDIATDEETGTGVAECFTKYHPDAKAWLPGNPIHTSKWTRLVVQEIYWVGGFGDRAYIGWIPAEQWRNVTEEEIRKVRLPGEKEQGEGCGRKETKKGWWEWVKEDVLEL